MCGIAGLLQNDPDAPIDRSRLESMVEALAHRGPDDRGFHVDRNVGFGVRRLAIVDPGGGHQPIASEDGAVRVVYNGECYNFADLAAQLTTAGHRFRSRTDTEVLVHGYELWGLRGLVARLNGIFAFCLWDSRTRTAYLVRDRLGVKPLFYAARASGVAFASELRALVRSGLCAARLHGESVWRYLLYQFAPTEQTPLAGVRRLPAAHLLEWRSGQPLRLEQYWDVPGDAASTSASFDEAVEQVRDLLDDSVKRQLLGDVPIGCFLSGGLDSSAIAALMARHAHGPLRTYSIGFPSSPDYDETPWALAAARAVGSRHTTISFDERRLREHVDDYLSRIDEPVGDAAMIATDLLASAASRDVKVVLTGEGADEVFGGYPYYRERGANARPLPCRPGLLRQDPRTRSWRAVPVPGSASPHSGFPYALQPESIWLLLSQDERPSFDTFLHVLHTVEEREMSRAAGRTPLARALTLDRRIWLAHDLMTKLDKATMAHGLEGRVPMLDHRLVELAYGLPDAYKVGSTTGKIVLREAMRAVLPAAILDRSKQGFGVPLDDWLRGSLREVAHARLRASALVDEGLLTRSGVDGLLEAHCEAGVSLGRAIWSVLNLDGWWRELRKDIARVPPAGPSPSVSIRRPDPTVDIVIPIHGSLNLVRDCVTSLQRWTTRPFRAILANDGGDDDSQDRLARLIAGDPRFELVRNERALGFVRTCIAVMARCPADYIVVLNSDVVVTPMWLQRMIDCAESDPRIAIVNPLTNESGNTSVRLAPGLNLLTMARRVAQLSKRTYPDITTAVGMCMLIRRAAIEMFGGFDAVFDGAYCEESDLCMRFTEAGLRVVAADDAFVYHKGLGSYREDVKRDLYERNRKIFDERWAVPYERDWATYVRADPLQPIRGALLRGTTRAVGDPADVEAVEEGFARLRTPRALAAIADGRRARAAGVVLAERSDLHVEDRLRRASRDRPVCPEVRFDERAVAHPTRGYVASLPRADPGSLRITFLVHGFPLCGGIISIVQLVRRFIEAGHDVKVVTEAPMIEPEALNLWAQPLVYRNLDHLVDAFPPSDIVVATFWTTAHEYLPALHRRHDFTSVYFIQDYEAWFYDETDYPTRRAAERSYVKADHHIVKSRWLAELVRQHGATCDVVPIGLDLGVFYPRPSPPRVRPRIVSVAALEPRRGFAQTIAAFTRIHAARPDVELVFFGTPPSAMPSLPFPYTNAGQLPDPNAVAELISSCDVLIDASLWQGFGRPGLEAMACGTVPVLTNGGGIVEYACEGENCFLVDPRDPDAIARAALTLIADPRLHARLRHAGQATAAQFSDEVEAERHLALYRRWVQARSPRPRRSVRS